VVLDLIAGSPPPGSSGASGPAPAGLRTEFPFVLPRGYVDESGALHREGTMRLATARDEIAPLRDPRVRENEAYLSVLLLARVITRLGTLPGISPVVVEGMFASDLAFLQDLYRRVNQEGTTQAAVICPECHHEFRVEIGGGSPGES
jgi:hypothetical protein